MDTLRSAPPRRTFSRPNDDEARAAEEATLGGSPYPTSSGPPPARPCFLVASLGVGQYLGLAVGAFVSLAASLSVSPERPLSESPWLVLFVLVTLSAALSWYVATHHGPGGSTTGSFCCNWSDNADFRRAVADVLVICTGYGAGLAVTASGVPSGGAVVGGGALAAFVVHLTLRRYCCRRDSGGGA